jgi:hypothetical protein
MKRGEPSWGAPWLHFSPHFGEGSFSIFKGSFQPEVKGVTTRWRNETNAALGTCVYTCRSPPVRVSS